LEIDSKRTVFPLSVAIAYWWVATGATGGFSHTELWVVHTELWVTHTELWLFISSSV